MRRDSSLHYSSNIKYTSRRQPVKEVLLTGPTGFFGPFLLDSLLRRTNYLYHVVTRAKDPCTAMDRIRGCLARSRLLTLSLDRELDQRVRVVCGDLSKPDLGLQPDVWSSLSRRVQAVIHNAARVNYVLNYESLRADNVHATRELLRFAFDVAPKQFHLVSSTMIFGWTSNPELLENATNEDMLDLDFGYAQSKWVAEQLVHAAAAHGLSTCVYRPAFLSASTDGVASDDDIVVRLLAFMINHGIAVDAENQVSLVPADVAANNIAVIVGQGQIHEPALHVTTDRYYSMADITRTITRDFGYSFAYHDIPSFVQEMTRTCHLDEPIYPLLDFVTRSHLKVAAMQRKRYNNDAYRAARQRSRDALADPTLEQTVACLMQHMHQAGIIDRPPVSPPRS